MSELNFKLLMVKNNNVGLNRVACEMGFVGNIE